MPARHHVGRYRLRDRRGERALYPMRQGDGGAAACRFFLSTQAAEVGSNADRM
jgi:hypothetical protein